MVAVMITAIAVSGFCALEIGRVYYAQRQLQTLANTAAMDAVRVASGCADGVPDVASVNSSSMDTTVANAVAHSISVNQPSSTSFVPLTGLNSTTTSGRSINDIDTSGAANSLRYFNTLTTRPTADAVKVSLTAAEPAMLTGLISNPHPITMTATATARQLNIASWQVRTGLLNLNTANSALGPLLGIANLNLSVANYQSLLSASLPAASVAVALGVANPQNITSGSLASVSLPLGTALNSLANALTATGQSAAAGVLTGLASRVSSAYSVSPQGLFATSLTAISPLANLDAYDLLSALAQDVQQGDPITIPVTVTLLNSSTASVYVQITGPQQPGFGSPGLTSSAAPMDPLNTQLSSSSAGVISIRMGVGDGGILKGLLSVLSLLATVQPINIGVDISFPKSTGGLASLTCPGASGLAYNYGVNAVVQPIIVKAGTWAPYANGTAVNGTNVAPLTSGNLVSVKILGFTTVVAKLTQTASVNVGTSGSSTANIALPVPVATSTLPLYGSAGGANLDIISGVTSSVNTLLSQDLQLLPGILGVALNSLVSDVLQDVTAILTPLDTSVVNPVLGGLGLQLGPTQAEVDAAPPTPSGLPPVVVTERADANDTQY
jgi:uncharacterized membrane protein